MLCKKLSIFCFMFTGFYSNHSLRATCATRLFEQGVDEQLIAQKTGHRSNAIRGYKRPSANQEKEVSEIIQGHGDTSKRHCVSADNSTVTSHSGGITINVNLNTNK
jgi:hypothetical protein